MNLKDLVKYIHTASISYPTIQEFGEGDIYEFLNNGEHKYPCIFLTIESISTYNDTQNINTSLFYVDRLLSDNSNKLDVQTVAVTALKSIKEKLEELNYINFTSINYTPFTEKFADLCAGAFAQCTIQLNDELECDDYEFGTLTITENGLYNTLGYNSVLVDITRVRSIGGKSGDITLGDGLSIDDNNVLSAEGVIPEDIVNSIDGETGNISVGNGIICDGEIKLDENYIECDGNNITIKANGTNVIDAGKKYTTIKANDNDVIYSDEDSLTISSGGYTILSSQDANFLIANQYDESLLFNRHYTGGTSTTIYNGGEQALDIVSNDGSGEYANDLHIDTENVYFQGNEVRMYYKKSASIKLHIFDVKGTEAPVYIFVNTDVKTESRFIDYNPQNYELEAIFNIEYYNPLIKITVISDIDGLWVSSRAFLEEGSFNQDYHPIPISFIPYNYQRPGLERQENGQYAGFCAQFDMSAYNPDEEEIPELMYIQTAHLCYAEGTLITLADGTTKSVEDITYDDLLKVWNFDNGNIDSAYPIWIKKEETADEYALVKLANGNEIKLVGNDGKYHCLFDITESKFNHAIDCVGHLVYTEDGITEVESLDIIKEPTKYYNIVTNVHLNCFANHILTSTEKNNIYSIENMKYVYDNRKIVDYSVFEQYGISKAEYEGWRLGEQPMSVEECVKHIKLRNYYKNN